MFQDITDTLANLTCNVTEDNYVLRLSNYHNVKDKDLSTYVYVTFPSSTNLENKIKIKQTIIGDATWCLLIKLFAHPIHGLVPQNQQIAIKEKITSSLTTLLKDINQVQCVIYISCLYNNIEVTINVNQSFIIDVQQLTNFDDWTVINNDGLRGSSEKLDAINQLFNETNNLQCTDYREVLQQSLPDTKIIHRVKKYQAPYVAKEKALAKLKENWEKLPQNTSTSKFDINIVRLNSPPLPDKDTIEYDATDEDIVDGNNLYTLSIDDNTPIGTLYMVVASNTVSDGESYFLKVNETKYIKIRPPSATLDGKSVYIKAGENVFKLSAASLDPNAIMYKDRMYCVTYILEKLTQIQEGEYMEPGFEDKCTPPPLYAQPKPSAPPLDTPPASPPPPTPLIENADEYIKKIESQKGGCEPGVILKNIKRWSCYIDASLMALFYNPNRFIVENVLFSNVKDETGGCQKEKIKNYLKELTDTINNIKPAPVKSQTCQPFYTFLEECGAKEVEAIKDVDAYGGAAELIGYLLKMFNIETQFIMFMMDNKPPVKSVTEYIKTPSFSYFDTDMLIFINQNRNLETNENILINNDRFVLSSIVYHRSRHYVTFVKCINDWYEYNDLNGGTFTKIGTYNDVMNYTKAGVRAVVIYKKVNEPLI